MAQSMQNYWINEVFYSLQGEGIHAGRPAVFIRLQGCPNRCPWCDTAYALHRSDDFRLPDNDPRVFQKKRSSPYHAKTSLEYMEQQLVPYAARHCLCVLTGGEPCLQEILPLTDRLFQMGFTVTLETSGVLPVVCSAETFVTLSPKNHPVLEENWQRADEIKVPVLCPDDLLRHLDHLEKVPGDRVCLQPVSQDQDATRFCIETCLERNWRLSVQLHKYLHIQ